MKGLNSVLTICSFALLITLGVLVLVCAGLPLVRGGQRDLAVRTKFALQDSRQTDQEVQVLLALKVFGSGSSGPSSASKPDRRAESGSDASPGS